MCTPAGRGLLACSLSIDSMSLCALCFRAQVNNKKHILASLAILTAPGNLWTLATKATGRSRSARGESVLIALLLRRVPLRSTPLSDY